MIEVRSSAQVYGNLLNNVKPTISATSQVGDLAVLIAASQFSTTANRWPESWTGRYSSGINNRSGYIAYKMVGNPSETQEIDWLAGGDPGDGSRKVATLVVLTGVQSVDTLVAWQASPPDVTKTMVVASQLHATAATNQLTWEAETQLYSGDKQPTSTASWTNTRVYLTTTGVTGYPSPIGSGMTNPQAWCGIVMEPKADAGQPGPKAVKKTSLMPHGTASSSELKSATRFIVAHRGGSTSWVEHTPNAYTQAVAHGVNALEFSAAVTADGVIIGNHDQNFASLGGPSTPIKDMPWSHIQEILPPDKVPATLEWLLKTYGHSHTILFDPKNSAWTNLADYITALTPYKNNVVLKYAGDAVTWLFQSWHNAGFKVWAYVYPSEVNASWYQKLLSSSYVDFISMDQSATDEQFNAIRATDKAAVIHILTSPTAVSNAFSRGADGVMLAAVSQTQTLQV